MRATVLTGLAGIMLTGCIGWTGASELRSSNDAMYAGVVDTSPAVFVGPLPAMALGGTYTVKDCFGAAPTTVKDVPGLIFGAHPLDRVCRQYDKIDLRDYPPETADCFVEDPDAEPLATHPETGVERLNNKFRHPWQIPNPSAECAKLIADIQAARKVQ
jgi:hypothetical protein